MLQRKHVSLGGNCNAGCSSDGNEHSETPRSSCKFCQRRPIRPLAPTPGFPLCRNVLSAAQTSVDFFKRAHRVALGPRRSALPRGQSPRYPCGSDRRATIDTRWHAFSPSRAQQHPHGEGRQAQVLSCQCRIVGPVSHVLAQPKGNLSLQEHFPPVRCIFKLGLPFLILVHRLDKRSTEIGRYRVPSKNDAFSHGRVLLLIQ